MSKNVDEIIAAWENGTFCATQQQLINFINSSIDSNLDWSDNSIITYYIALRAKQTECKFNTFTENENAGINGLNKLYNEFGDFQFFVSETAVKTLTDCGVYLANIDKTSDYYLKKEYVDWDKMISLPNAEDLFNSLQIRFYDYARMSVNMKNGNIQIISDCVNDNAYDYIAEEDEMGYISTLTIAATVKTGIVCDNMSIENIQAIFPEIDLKSYHNEIDYNFDV